MANKAIEILIVSDSRLLIDGLRKIFESQICIKIIADLSGIKELQAFMEEREPDYVFLDKRVHDFKIEKYLRSKKIQNKATEVILLSDEDKNEDSPGRFIKISQKTSARELIDLITNRDNFREKIKNTDKLSRDINYSVTKTESRIINLITSGHTNKEIAEKLRVSEKTIKAHVTSIFTKLNIQNRYQLMVYGRRNMKRI